MNASVIDTNVLEVANENLESKTDDSREERKSVRDCIEACIDALIEARRGLIVLDAGDEIFYEYLNHACLSGEPGAGDEFLRWLYDNSYTEAHCERVKIHFNLDKEDYDEFPDDPALAGFDRSDRKFVAVALKSENQPEILNAIDSDWWDHREALERNGLRLRFLCPERVKRRKV